MYNKIIMFEDQVSDSNFGKVEIARLREFNIEYMGSDCSTEDELIDAAKDADIIYNSGLVNITIRTIESLPKLKAVVRRGIGCDNIDIETAAKRGIIVSNTPGFCADEVSTQAVAFLLSFARKIPMWDKYIKEGRWINRKPETFEGQQSILGEDVGIIGFGHIGKGIANKLNPFGVIISIYDPYVKLDKKYEAESVSLDGLLKKSKYIILSCSLTKETEKILDGEQFKLMRKDAVIINVSRGQLINEKVLIRYLKEGKIGGAALDVFEKEPVEKENPLLKMDNVILTPHNASKSCKSAALQREMSLEEIIRIATRQKPQCQVN